jgi:hypothetical protein
MAIPDGINRDHVLQAMAQLGPGSAIWPRGSRSTVHDVINPRDGMRFPPKLVVSKAAEIATGRPLSRRDFSGGPETNDRLMALGFKILPKHSDQPS